MKNIIKNSSLVLVLSFLFALPMLGFRFVSFAPGTEVLGTQIREANSSPKEVPTDGLNNNEVEIVDQIELTISLSDDEFQKFYDVIPEEKLKDPNTYVVVVPNEYREQGLTAELELTEMKADLNIQKPAKINRGQVSLTILVL